jgi:hypothetical protein
MLANTFGLAADQTLEFEVITTDGRFLTASPLKNKELFRALSGGVSTLGFYLILHNKTAHVLTFRERGHMR